MSGAKTIPSLFACIVIMVLAIMQATTTLAQDTPQDYLAGHNAARAAVGVADMSWNYTVQAYAEDYANQRSADCSLTHSQGGPYGENLYGGPGGTEFYAADAVASWVDEGQYYDYNTNSCSLGENKCGHYTQVVWHDSTQLGCARVVCDNDAGMFIICSYYPRGNWIGERPY